MNKNDKAEMIALLSDDKKGNNKGAGHAGKGSASYANPGKPGNPLMKVGIAAALVGVAVVGYQWMGNNDTAMATSHSNQTPSSTPTQVASTSTPTQVASTSTQPVSSPKPAASTSTSKASSDALLNASGYVTARRTATVSSRTLGRVETLYAEEGEQVKTGQVLAQLENKIETIELAQAKSALVSAKARLDEINVRLKEAKDKLANGEALTQHQFIPEDELITLRANFQFQQAALRTQQNEVKNAELSVKLRQQLLNDLVITSPFSGTIISKNAQAGEIVSPSSAGGGFTRTGIYTLVDMNSLEIEVDVSEDYISRLSAGTRASAVMDAFPDEPIPAEVIAIVPTANRSKETVRVRVKFLETDERILPEMAVRVKFLQ